MQMEFKPWLGIILTMLVYNYRDMKSMKSNIQYMKTELYNIKYKNIKEAIK